MQEIETSGVCQAEINYMPTNYAIKHMHVHIYLYCKLEFQVAKNLILLSSTGILLKPRATVRQ